jgi:hypothetical protein
MHCPTQHSSEDPQLFPASRQQRPLSQIDPAMQSAGSSHVPSKETGPLAHVPSTQTPEQQSPFAAHVALVSLQQRFPEQTAPDTQSADSSHVSPRATGPEAHVLLTQMPEQQSAFEEQLSPLIFLQTSDHSTVQSVWPTGHVQTPARRVNGEEQLVPHAPQSLLSVWRFLHPVAAQ